MLEDAFKLTFSRDQKQVERYLKQVQERIIALPYDQWFTLQNDEGLQAKVRLQRAAHMFGSAYVVVGALLFYIVLSLATMGIVTYAAASVMGVRDSLVRNYMLTSKDVICELDTDVWSLQPGQQGAARIKAFNLFGFCSILLLCPQNW